ncbi:unnamed protein product [Rotaria sordida]|uniref:Nephrin/kirre n=1 Tax=Rotaria sordida TaxID=392033 RepID=A0A815S6H9_9BILA|nr:unnamed protein product [Rotaria sordida]
MPLSLFIKLFIFYTILYLSNSQNQYYQIRPYDISALIGSNITIPCVITSPHGDVQWTKDGLALGYDRQLPAFPSWSIIGNENRGEFNFFIQSLKFEDEGAYACEVSPYNNAPALKQIAHIQTLVRPEYLQINDQSLSNETTIITMRFDEKIHQIKCQVDGAKPAAHIKWINESGHELPAISRILMKDNLFSTISTLTLIPSLLLDKKRFMCDVRHETLNNNMNLLRSLFEIQITSPPNIPIIHGYSSTFHLINDSSLTLSCQSFGGYPLGKLSWYRFENESLYLINNSSSIIHYQENIIENNITMIIKPSDNNVRFSCHVTNDYLDSLGQILQTNITLHVAFGPSSVHILNNNMNITTLIEGIPQRFLCRTSSSNPRPIVIWKVDEQILPADIHPLVEPGEFYGTIMQSTKTIGIDKSLIYYHNKLLSCEATNPDTGHTVIDSIKLNIIYDAISINMYGLTKDKIIQAGDTVIAECILVGGNPLGKIVWYKGDELLRSEYLIETNETYISSRIEFLALPSDNNLLLTCKGQVEKFPEHIASFQLNVIYLPEKIIIIGNEFFSNLSMDDDICNEFECRTSISNPQTQLTIIRQSNDGEKHFDIRYKTSSIYINGINSIKFMLPRIDHSLHESLLICQAILDINIPLRIKQVTYTLYVNHKPYFQDFNRSIEVKEGQSFNITLEAKAYPMLISYTWFHPSGRQLLNDNLNIFINQGQLSLMNVQRHDLGIYRCIATNSIGYTEVNFTLNVLYGPIIIRTQAYSISESLMPGSSAILICVIDGNPIDFNTVQWFKDNQEISFDQWEKRNEGNEASLIKKSIHQEDAGQYTCEIDNQFGNTHAILPLIVQYAPEIDRSVPSRSKVATDSDRLLTAELHCYVSSIPKPTVIWMKDDQVLLPSSRHQSIVNEQSPSSTFSSNLLFEAILYVYNVTKSDYGIYQCKIENKLGIDMIQIILTGITIPDPPSQVHITNISHSSLLINWIPGFDGGAQQTFQIRYRLSTDNHYIYENVPYDIQSFDLINLKLGSQYHLSIRSNNSYHLSKWTDEIIITTLNYLPILKFHLSEISSTNISFTLLIIIAIIGFIILFVNIILICFFIIKRRQLNITSENSSTTGTNETETNTIDIFQPIPSNFFLTTTTTNSYKKYEDDDIKRPFVSSYSSDNRSSYASLKKNCVSPYDNVRLHHCYPADIDNNLVTYRSFKDGISYSTDMHDCIRTELV